MRKLGLAASALTGGVGLAMLLGVGQAAAAPTCSGTTDVFASGVGTVTDAFLATAGNCVLAGDKLFGNFTGIGALPAGGSIGFNLNTIAGEDHHTISFNNNYATGSNYSLGFEVEVSGSPLTILELDGDFTQSGNVGTSNLVKNSAPTGTPASGINMTKVGATLQPGSVVSITYPGVTDLVVNETLTDGGAVSSIIDTVVESGTVTTPEPASLALVGLGLSALALARRRKLR